MLTTAKNWKLIAYVNDTWTGVVNEVATVAAILIVNTDLTNPVSASLRLSGGAVILPMTRLAAGSSFSIDIRSLNITTGESLQLIASAAGVNVVASGAV